VTIRIAVVEIKTEYYIESYDYVKVKSKYGPK
jgi:hypothetical protein